MKSLYIIQLFVAAAMLFMGLLVAARPYFLLDVVLTPEQLSDPSIHDATLSLMQKATGSDSIWWFVLGCVVGGIALVGLRISIFSNE